MKPGTKPKPKAVKELQGNPGRRKINENAPAFEGTTTVPNHLDRIAKNEWRRLAPRLEFHAMLTPADRTAFAAYCVAYSTHVRAELALQEKANPFGYKTPGGVLRPWPEAAQSRDALNQMYRFLTEFGLTPSSRTRLNIANPKQPSTDESFLFGDEPTAGDECKNADAN